MWLPLPVDLALHVVPALALCADFMLLESKFSKNEARYGAPLVISLAAVWYASWVEYCASSNGTCEQSLLLARAFIISQYRSLSSLSLPHGKSLRNSRWYLYYCYDSRVVIFLDLECVARKTSIDDNKCTNIYMRFVNTDSILNGRK
jgi:hypothetical protein